MGEEKSMNDYERLKEFYDEADKLIRNKVTAGDQRFKDWKLKVSRYLSHRYGIQSVEMEEFRKTEFEDVFDFDNAEKKIETCRKGLEATKRTFKIYLKEISKEILENAQKSMRQQLREMQKERYEDGMLMNASQEVSMKKAKEYKKVFIVHGHDNGLKQEVARLVEKQGLEAIILSEQANRGKTIIEKFEEHSDVGAAICLFTGDDYGRTKDAEEDKLRARQNVVFEAGFFMGKLGRENVVLIANPDIEIPSDLKGFVYTNEKSWQIDALKELKTIGYAIDLNKLF